MIDKVLNTSMFMLSKLTIKNLSINKTGSSLLLTWSKFELPTTYAGSHASILYIASRVYCVFYSTCHIEKY